MTRSSRILDVVLKSTVVVLLFNEVRGLILAAPILYGMYHAGGSIMALWIGFCSLAGIAASVIIPMFVANRLRRIPTFQSA